MIYVHGEKWAILHVEYRYLSHIIVVYSYVYLMDNLTAICK